MDINLSGEVCCNKIETSRTSVLGEYFHLRSSNFIIIFTYYIFIMIDIFIYYFEIIELLYAVPIITSL